MICDLCGIKMTSGNIGWVVNRNDKKIFRCSKCHSVLCKPGRKRKSSYLFIEDVMPEKESPSKVVRN